MKKKALVVGSGFGGIASALRLKRLGFDVTILEKLNQIEKSIFKSTRRNYWMTASLIFTLFVIITTYFYLNNLYIINHPIYLYMVLLSILIIVMRPRKK